MRLDLSAQTLSYSVNDGKWTQIGEEIWTKDDLYYRMSVFLGNEGDRIELLEHHAN